MKAFGLTIGDIVCLDGDTNYSEPLIIDAISKDDVSLEGVGYLGGIEGCIIPVPLTKEILALNGFLDYGEIMEYHFEEDGEKYHFYLKAMYNKDNVCDAFGTNIGGVLPSVIMYVHELQQALRLAGLKEISNNLKVK